MRLARVSGQHVNNTKVQIKDSIAHQNFMETIEKVFKAFIESIDHIHARNIQIL
jgi:hypothetical protein